MREYDSSKFSLMTVEEEAKILSSISEFWEAAEEQGFEALVAAPCRCQDPTNHDFKCGWGMRRASK